MIAIAFCGLAAAICAVLLFHVGWRIKSSPATTALDSALSVAAFSAIAVAMSAGWILAAGTPIRVDIQIGSVMVGVFCASVGAAIWAVLVKVKSVTLTHWSDKSTLNTITMRERNCYGVDHVKGFRFSDGETPEPSCRVTSE